MAFFRTLLVWGAGLPVTAFFFALMLISYVFGCGGRCMGRLTALWGGAILALAGVRLNISGVDNIPRGRAVMFMSNHQGAFDIPALQRAIPADFRWVAKKSLFKTPLIGWAMSIAGYIPIERENAASAFKSLEAAADRIRMGVSVVIFPEGTRSQSDELLPFKRGAFMLAVKSGVPVVPVAIKGTKGILKRGGFFITPADVSVSFGVPFPTEGMEEKTLRTMTKDSIKEMLA
ncbi:MAG: 1-acyl-sn-glycerol-3-phosphate acyltransferase [Deltaproteobacteria bacterium]|nr:1-acyl-sn-glycerol-3-phosphate acyltransferase [Deltaproteobacteria bacterium]